MAHLDPNLSLGTQLPNAWAMFSAECDLLLDKLQGIAPPGMHPVQAAPQEINNVIVNAQGYTLTVDGVFDHYGFETCLLLSAVRGVAMYRSIGGEQAWNGQMGLVECLLKDFHAIADLDPQTRRQLGTTPLIEAIQFEDPALVSLLLKYGAKNDTADGAGQRPVDVLNALTGPQQADGSFAESPMKSKLQSILFGECEESITPKIEDECVALVQKVGDQAALQKLEDWLKALPQLCNAELSFEDELTTTLLFTAARAKNVEAVKLLMGKGADPNVSGSTLNTPMHVACYRGYVEVVKELLGWSTPNAKKYDYLKVNNWGENCLSTFAPDVTSNQISQIRQLIQLPTQDLFDAVLKSDEKNLQKFLAAFPADTILKQQQGGAPVYVSLLMFSIQNNCPKSCELLLKGGADPNGVPLEEPSVEEHVQPLAPQAMSPSGANSPPRFGGRYAAQQTTATATTATTTTTPGTPDNRPPKATPGSPSSPTRKLIPTEVPLLSCFRAKNLTIGKLLAAHGANVRGLYQDAQSTDEHDYFLQLMTDLEPVDRAMNFVCGRSGGTKQDLEAFLKNPGGSDKDGLYRESGDSDQMTLLAQATVHKNKVAMTLLLQAGCSGTVNRNPVSGATPLHEAVRLNFYDGVQLLLQQGAFDLSIKDFTPKTCRELATDATIAKMLDDKAAELKQQKEIQELQTYLKSLPSRRDASLPQVQVNVSGSSPTTQTVVKDALAHASKCTKEVKQTLIYGAHANPLTRDFLQLAEISTLQHDSLMKMTIQSLNQVAVPNLFPIDIRTLFESQYAQAAKDLADTIMKRFHPSLHPEIQPAVSKFLAVKPDEFVLASAQLAAQIASICEKFLRRELESNASIGCFTRSFYLDTLIKKAQEEYMNAASLQNPKGLLVACASSSTQQSMFTLIPATYTDFDDFFKQVSVSWNAPEYQLLVTAIKTLSKKKILTSKKAELADKEIEDFFDKTCQQLLYQLQSSLGSDCKGEVQKRVIELCGKAYGEATVNRYRSGPSKELQPDGKPLPQSSFPTLREGEKYFLDPKYTVQVLNGLIAEQPPPTTQVTPGSQNSYQQALRKHQNKLNAAIGASPSPFQTSKQLLSDFLRPMNLDYSWRNMPMYEFVDQVDIALAHSKVVLCIAHTGSGKSVLLPQNLAFKGRKVVVTQPRRMPVVQISKYVQSFYGEDRVGFAIGGMKNPNPKGELQFKTDSLFLSECLHDYELAVQGKYPHQGGITVVIDEVHERSPTIDMLYLTLLQTMAQFPALAIQVVLASATVDKTFFINTAKCFGINLTPINIVVSSPYSITDLPTPVPFLPWPEPSGKGAPAPPKRGQIAAQDAFDIVSKDKQAKVLVFLPHVIELDAALKDFQGMCNISCATLHANAEQTDKKVQQCRVLFSNNIAETSLTIPGLSHVLDFNLSMIVDIDAPRNCRTLKIGQGTGASQKQRRGRLGRRQAGFYRNYYDVTTLPPVNTCGFDLLPNDELAQMEIRARVFLKKTLFQNQPNTLGLGMPYRKEAEKFIPASAPTEMEVAAQLSFSGAMSQSFFYALKANTVPLAMLWLTTMTASRENPTKGKHLDTTHCRSNGFGQHGDHGVLLDIYQTFLDEKQKAGAKFDVEKWADSLKLNPHFFQNVDDRMETVLRICEQKLKFNVQGWKGFNQWKWSDLEDALMAGLWPNTVRKVDHNLNDYNYSAPYHQLDSLQTTCLSIFGSSILNTGTAAQHPDYAMYGMLEKRAEKGRRFMKHISEVSEACIDKWTKHEQVTQSLALVGKMWSQHQSMFPNKAYPNCRIETSAINFSQGLRDRAGPNAIGFLKVEFVVTGARIQVAKTMDLIAADIDAAANAPMAPPTTGNSAQAFGTPPVSVATLRSLGQNAVANRVEKATKPRTASDLKQDLQSNDKQKQALALINILINDFKVTVLGGIVRDVVVRGLSNFKDVDSVAPGSLQQSSWQSTISNWQSQLDTTYGLKCTHPQARPSLSPTGEGIITFFTLNGSVEIELVTPWNKGYVPVQNMNFSCNNLRIGPGTTDIQLSYPILLSGIDIVRQLNHNPPQTSPHRDCQWTATIPSGKQAEGLNRNSWLEGITQQMKDSIDKFRNTKHFWFVEAPLVGAGGKTIILYHGTSPQAASAIIAGQNFHPSKTGNLGPGVYMSRDLTIVNMFKSGSGKNMLQADVDPRRVKTMPGWDSSGSWRQQGAYDTAFLSQACSPRAPPLEEWCIWNPNQITHIRYYP